MYQPNQQEVKMHIKSTVPVIWGSTSYQPEGGNVWMESLRQSYRVYSEKNWYFEGKILRVEGPEHGFRIPPSNQRNIKLFDTCIFTPKST